MEMLLLATAYTEIILNTNLVSNQMRDGKVWALI